jgi:hypothetical protein
MMAAIARSSSEPIQVCCIARPDAYAAQANRTARGRLVVDIGNAA